MMSFYSGVYIAILMQACTEWTHSDVWSQLAPTPEWLFEIGNRQSAKKRRNGDRRAICNALRGIDAGRRLIRHRGVSDDSEGARPLWRSHSAQTEMFFADVLLDYLTTEVALEEPEIGSTDPNILIDNNCMDDELQFGMPGGSRDYKDEGDESDKCNAIPTASRPWRPVTELKRFDLATSDVDGYEGNDGDDADADEEEEASLANDESTQNMED